MADVDLYGVDNGAPRHPACNPETQILHTSERDILRAARARARNWRNPEDTADELAQAARLRVWDLVRKTGTVPGVAYLRKVIANAVRTPLAGDPVLEAASDIDSDDSEAIDGRLEQSDPLADDAVRAWIDTLPPPLQRVYHLLFVKECSQREAATILGVSQPRIAQMHRTLLERGRRDLRQLAA